MDTISPRVKGRDSVMKVETLKKDWDPEEKKKKSVFVSFARLGNCIAFSTRQVKWIRIK